MKKRKTISAILIMTMLFAALYPLGAAAVGPNPTRLDISAGNINITADGAAGGGLSEPETELNEGGYVITGSSDVNVITVESGVETSIELNGVTVTSDKAGTSGNVASPLTIYGDSVVHIDLTGVNILAGTSTYSSGIALGTDADLYINGNGELAVSGGLTGIGSLMSSVHRKGKIEINGGIISATGARGSGIGGTQNRSGGEIIINGGTVSAVSTHKSGSVNIAGIGDGRVPSDDRTIPVIINGGSVNATIQDTPENENGEELRLITAYIEGGAGKTFTLTSADGSENTAKSDDEGKLYLYISKTTSFVSVTSGSTMYYASDLAANADLEVDLERYSGAPCSCSPGNSAIAFDDQNISVNTTIGEETVALAAAFEAAEGCQYPMHALADAVYSLKADVTHSEAVISERELTVYSAAADKDIEVTVTALINGTEYSKTAVFHVTIDDSYAVDLSDGDIVISETQVTVGSTVYDFEDTSRPIRIFQSGSAINRTIYIERTVKGREVILDNVNMTQTALVATPRITVSPNAVVTFTLSGENKAIQYEGVAAPAVYLAGGSTLTIKGSGTLYTSGGYANVAIGAPNRDTMGTLIIESGKITAIGGVESESAHDAAPAIGVPIGGNQGGKLILKGGVLDAKGASGSDRGDINTEVVIDGGSLVSPVTIYNCGFNQYVPKNSSGREVYLTELTMEGVSGAVDIEYYVTTGSGTESDAISSALDENGKLYLYFPADGNYRKIRAHINDATGEYFKRIKVTDDIENNKGELTKNPTGAITNFYIVGQNSSDIDEENNIITVKVPSLMDLTNCRPSVETGGLEYFPSGNVNFQDNPEITFSVVLDSGETVEYTVKIERVDSEADTMTVLDISAGNIIMFSEDLSTDPDDQTGIFIGDAAVVPNPNGYVITGESDTNFIYIEEITAPIVFRDLVINSPILNEEANAPLTVAGTSVNLEIEGVNEISGSAANSAMYLFEESSLSVSGGGILILRGGAGANGVAADNENHRFVIGDTSVFIIDGENTPEHSLANPVNEAGELLYPLIVTIDDINAADSEMIYSDTRYNAAGEIVSAVQSVKMLSDGSARLSLYKPAGYYEVSVLWNGDVYYSEDRTPVSSENTPGDPAEVTLTIPSISGLSFTDPESSLEQRVTVILSGTNLGGNMIVTATGENGEKVSAKALKNGDVWQAVLTIPANKSVTGVYRWTLSAKIGDIEQELSKTYYIDMWRKLAVTSFSIDEEKQVGDADIDHNNKLVTIVVPYDVDLETTNFRPKYEHTGDIFIGDWGGSMVNLFNPASVYLAYTSGAADEVIYNIRAQKQEAPSVAEISFEQPADYNGGDVVITLTGENLDNLINASTDAAKRIVVSAAGKNVYVTRPVPDGEGGTAWQATVPVPDNINGAQTAKYPISITINSVEQEFKGPHEIIVPARIEALANIAGFAFSDAEGNPIEAVSVEITDGTVGSVNGGTSGTPGKIAVVLPSGTNLAETALIPSVALENPQANLRIIDAEGNEYGIGEAIIFTETNIPVTLAVISEDGENTMSYELEVTVQTRRKSSGKSNNDNVTAGAVTYEAYAGGYEDNTFRPDNIITRAEAAALLARLDADFDETVPYESYEQSFYDVVPSNWYAKYIGYLAHEGVITGYEDGSFMPSKQITRMEFAALLSRFADSTGIELKDMEKELAGASARNVSGVNISTASASAQEAFTDMTKHIALNALTASAAISDADWEPAVPLSDISGLWGESHIVGLADAGVVSGYEDGTFRPENSTTRAETVTMLNRMLGRTVTSEFRTAISDAENKFSDLSEMHWAYYDIMAAAHSYTVKTSTIKGTVNVTVELNK